jgi:hypothetical protein
MDDNILGRMEKAHGKSAWKKRMEKAHGKSAKSAWKRPTPTVTS